MQITTDTRVKTRNGLDVTLLADDAPGVKPLVGYIVFSGGEITAATWKADGTFFEDGLKSCNDLIPVKPSEMTLNGIDPETLADLIEEGMDNAHDMDTTFSDYAKAAAENVLKHLGEPA